MNRYLYAGALVICALLSDSTSQAQTKQPAKQTLKLLGETKFEIKRHIHAAAFSPDGKLLALAEENVHLYDISEETPKSVGLLKSRVGFGIRSIEFSPDGKRLAFGGCDHSVRFWDVEKQEELFQSKEHKGDVRSVTFSPDGKLLATGSDDKTTFLWNVGSDGKLVERGVIKANDKLAGAVKAVVFAQKGKALVTGSSNGTFRVYSISPSAVKQTSMIQAKGGFGDVNMASSPGGALWAISDRKTVHLLNRAGLEVGTLQAHKEDVSDVAFSPDGKFIATAGRDGAVHVWSASAKAIRVSKERPGKFSCVAWAPKVEGSTDLTLAAALEDGTVWVLKLGFSK